MKFVQYLSVLLLILGVHDAYAQRKKYIYQAKEEKTALEETVKKEIYRVDYLLPLNLENFSQKIQRVGKVPKASRSGVNYYEGVLLAIDSLNKLEDRYFDIFVHDVSKQKDLDRVVSAKVFDSTDLIIGAVSSDLIAEVAATAKANHVNFVSALSPSDGGVRDNPYFILLQPTLNTHLNKLISAGNRKFSGANTILIYREEATDAGLFSYFKGALQRKHHDLKILNKQLDINQLISVLEKGVPNLLYTTVLNPRDANELVKQLRQVPDEYQLEVMGLPSWKGLRSLRNPEVGEQYINQTMNVYVTNPFSFDTDKVKRSYLFKKYKKFKRGYPSELVFRGYENTLWLTDLLHNYGTLFNKRMFNYPAFITEYEILTALDNSGDLKYMENNKLYIYNFKNGVIHKILD